MYYTYLNYVGDLYKPHRKKFFDDNFYWNNCWGYFKCEDAYNANSLKPMLIGHLKTFNKASTYEELSSIIDKYSISEIFNLVNKQAPVNFTCTKKGDPIHRISYKLGCKYTKSSEN